MIQTFGEVDLKKLYHPPSNSSKGQNGRVTIIGGSKLFHGAPLLALTTASRIVDMVFFASPEPSVGMVAEQLKSKLFSFIWVPWEETEDYIRKSDAVLIGSGMMRYKSEEEKMKNEKLDSEGIKTKNITEDLLKKFPEKKWVIDAGSLQTIDPAWIPQNTILTPNKKEYKILFGNLDPGKASEKYKCNIVLKGPITYVYSTGKAIEIKGGNAGLTKGGTGDVQAGLTVALLAKNEPFLAASAASFIVKRTADRLYEKVGTFYNADDLVLSIPELLKFI